MASNGTGMAKILLLKCSLRVTVHSCFSYRDTMQLQVVQRRQTAVGYVRMLQRSALGTEGPRLCNDEWYFQQDNGAIHNAPALLTYRKRMGSVF